MKADCLIMCQLFTIRVLDIPVHMVYAYPGVTYIPLHHNSSPSKIAHISRFDLKYLCCSAVNQHVPFFCRIKFNLT